MEKPKVIYNKNKQFVMWFHQELKGKGYYAALTGLTVSVKVKGPYKYVHSIRGNQGHWPVNVKPIHKEPKPKTTKASYCGGLDRLQTHPDEINLLGRDFEKGQMARDMTLFVDDDGGAYHIYFSEENSHIQILKLSDDYLSFPGEYARAFSSGHIEAPSVFKRKGKYYFRALDCTGWNPNALRLAVSDHIFGPYKQLRNPCVSEGKDLTYNSLSTYMLPVQGKEDAFIFMADRWNPEKAIDGLYIWLRIKFDDNEQL